MKIFTNMLGRPEGRGRATPIFGENLITCLKVDDFLKFFQHRGVLDPGKLLIKLQKKCWPTGGVAGPRPFLGKN